ncbi:DUF1178 family protein [Rhodovulum sp. MB263]|uniref:DUF1178 family protein n=1 Tax=Rhodovulum sp. (strain MB263) TaxID=308754 RepID=UPI0009B7C3A0|nr:DUF1178 family protein [Rhodovulum sp. MB263]ARC88657.1 hypothetical protein B5V46_08520 [Rhodovulum sp. MB263]
MIRYALTCAEGHRFDSWFQSASAFDTLLKGGHVACSHCGSRNVSKALMAPSVATDRPAGSGAPAPEDGPGQNAPPAERPLSAPASPAEQALTALRKRIEETSEHVGLRFAQEARDIHAGLRPDRPIHGEARPDEAIRLIEDGIPVAPLPFLPGRKRN